MRRTQNKKRGGEKNATVNEKKKQENFLPISLSVCLPLEQVKDKEKRKTESLFFPFTAYFCCKSPHAASRKVPFPSF